MTVQELIDNLSTVKDKSVEVTVLVPEDRNFEYGFVSVAGFQGVQDSSDFVHLELSESGDDE